MEKPQALVEIQSQGTRGRGIQMPILTEVETGAQRGCETCQAHTARTVAPCPGVLISTTGFFPPLPLSLLSSKTYLWTQAGICKHLEVEERRVWVGELGRCFE